MCGNLPILHGEVRGLLFKIGVGQRCGTRTYQIFMAYPIDMP